MSESQERATTSNPTFLNICCSFINTYHMLDFSIFYICCVFFLLFVFCDSLFLCFASSKKYIYIYIQERQFHHSQSLLRCFSSRDHKYQQHHWQSHEQCIKQQHEQSTSLPIVLIAILVVATSTSVSARHDSAVRTQLSGQERATRRSCQRCSTMVSVA